jgi:hypothetical protein
MKQRFSLHISVDQMQRYYRGEIRSVMVQSEQGVRIQFPATHLRRFMGANGVWGRFEIEYDGQGTMISLQRI